MSGNTFDDRAATWDEEPSHVERAQAVAAALRGGVPLDSSTRMLEYGAGTGLVSQALQDTVGPITMADTSQGMRTVMADKIAAGTIRDARVWDIDLAAETASVPDDQFDLIVSVMTLHHIHHLDRVLLRFAGLLTESGRLAIVDLEKEDGSFHPAGFDGHHGFDRDALVADLHTAGFTGVAFRACHQVVKDGHTYPLFLATASRDQSSA